MTSGVEGAGGFLEGSTLSVEVVSSPQENSRVAMGNIPTQDQGVRTRGEVREGGRGWRTWVLLSPPSTGPGPTPCIYGH